MTIDRRKRDQTEADVDRSPAGSVERLMERRGIARKSDDHGSSR